MKNSRLLLCILLLGLMACSYLPEKKNAFAAFIDLGHEGMVENVEYLLRPPFANEADSLKFSEFAGKPCAVSLVVRYSNQCPMKSLPLSVEALYNIDDSVINQKFKIDLFDRNGAPVSPGNYGVYQARLPLTENQILDYNFYVSVSTPQQNASGILALGVEYEKL